MINIIRILSVLFVFIYYLPVAYGADCGNAGDAVSIMQCHEQRYIKADKELNAIYRAAMKSLPENEKQKLQSAQKAWLKYRDASFDFVIEQNKENRSFGGISVSDYKASVVEKRVLELKHLLSGPEAHQLTGRHFIK